MKQAVSLTDRYPGDAIPSAEAPADFI